MVTGRDPANGRTIDVHIENATVAAVERARADADVWIAPGLIDLQVNGYFGHDLNAGAPEPGTVIELARELLRTGVTTFLPTIITASEERIMAGLAAVDAARAAQPFVAAMIPFAHIEGPFISADDGPRGAHPREWVRPIDRDEIRRWRSRFPDLVKFVTLSPHETASDAVIAALRQEGVHVAIGHTHASPDRIRAAARAGASLSTHLGNGAAAILPRHPNMIWAQLAEDSLTATFIADGHHLPADAFTAMLRAKTIDRAILVSDVTALGGMKPGIYEQTIGGRVELTADGRLGSVGAPYLAGAARPLKDDVAIAARMAQLSLADALTMATTNPGRIVGGRGALAAGATADLIQFRWSPGDETLDIRTVIHRGEEVA